MSQSYKNYKKYYPPHHFIFLPVMTGLTVLGFVKAFTASPERPVWLLLGTLSFCMLYLAIMLRQHYALGNQDRIVRLEFRLRYFELFGESATKAEQQLSFGQIAALRFAEDQEFKKLLNDALTRNIGPEEIKKSITRWRADDMRV